MKFLFGLATMVGRLIGLTEGSEEFVLPRWTPTSTPTSTPVGSPTGAGADAFSARGVEDKWLTVAESGRAVPTTWISVRGGGGR